MAYTWIPFYKELAQKLLRFRNDRTPLVNWIYDNLQGYINHLKDAPDGRRVPDVDPFTVFAIFNRGITDDKRIDICEKFKRFLDVSASVPQDFDAIPVMNAKQSNFMAFADRREEGDLERLWNVFELAVLDKNIEDAYNALSHQYLIKFNITFGLFWIRPDKYLALDGNNRANLKLLGITTLKGYRFVPYKEYKGITGMLGQLGGPAGDVISAYMGGDTKGALKNGNTYKYDVELAMQAAEALGEAISYIESGVTPYELAEYNYVDIYNHERKETSITNYSDIFYTVKQNWLVPGSKEAMMRGTNSVSNQSNWNFDKLWGPKVAGLVAHDAIIHLPTANYVNYAYGMANGEPILLADGNPQNRAFLESLLRINYNLLLAEDGEQAIELLNEHENNISLALIEANLPVIVS